MSGLLFGKTKLSMHKHQFSLSKANFSLDKVRLYNRISQMSCLILVLVILIIFSPSSTEDTNALTTLTTTDNSLSIALSPDITMQIFPESSGKIITEEGNLRVSSGFKDGYSVYVSSSSPDMRRSDTGNGEIKAITSDLSTQDFPINSWGYNLNSTKGEKSTLYHGMTQEEVNVASRDTASADEYTLNLATKIDTSLPAGHYGTEFTVSVVANPLKVSTLSELTYMQDMTPEICQNTPLMQSNPSVIDPDDASFNDYSQPVTKQLIDKRDNKMYWVARLADGNCWMTQNLALDLNQNQPLTAATSDLHTIDSYTGSSTTILDTTQQYSRDSASWNLGKRVLAVPLFNKGCGQIIQYIDSCSSVGLTDVSGPEWQATYTAQQGDWSLPDGEKVPKNLTYKVNHGAVEKTVTVPNIVAVDTTNLTYDAHYLLGNYYQPSISAAGIRDVSQYSPQESANSICPKGWRLPKHKTISTTDEGRNFDFEKLFKRYGLTEYPVGKGQDGKDYALMAPPLYLTASGRTYYWDTYNENRISEINGQGSYTTSSGYYRSDDLFRIAAPTFSQSSVNTLNGRILQNNGVPVRCRAQIDSDSEIMR